jgi:hypothetical protein
MLRASMRSCGDRFLFLSLSSFRFREILKCIPRFLAWRPYTEDGGDLGARARIQSDNSENDVGIQKRRSRNRPRVLNGSHHNSDYLHEVEQFSRGQGRSTRGRTKIPGQKTTSFRRIPTLNPNTAATATPMSKQRLSTRIKSHGVSL